MVRSDYTPREVSDGEKTLSMFCPHWRALHSQGSCERHQLSDEASIIWILIPNSSHCLDVWSQCDGFLSAPCSAGLHSSKNRDICIYWTPAPLYLSLHLSILFSSQGRISIDLTPWEIQDEPEPVLQLKAELRIHLLQLQCSFMEIRALSRNLWLSLCERWCGRINWVINCKPTSGILEYGYDVWECMGSWRDEGGGCAEAATVKRIQMMKGVNGGIEKQRMI